MAYLHRAVACLRIAVDCLIPSEISILLGAEPRTHLFRVKGQEIPLKFGNVRIAKTGQWHLHSTDTEPESLDAQVAEILEKLTPDLSVWLDLSNRFEISF